MSQEVVRFADVGMYLAEPDPTAGKDVPIEPRVTLLSQTANPLRVMAAAAEMYRGRIVRDITEITEQEALFWLSEMTNTKIQAGLEFIDFHFLFEGVSRGFTHQLVRQRTAVFVQESQRFAVKENAALEISMPPSIASRKPDDPMRIIWENANSYDAWVYNALIAGGIPAEDARGRLPTNITTRVHYKTNLRNLAEHSGLRLCSQAQHEWKAVWSRIVTAILSYGPEEERWQQRAIASLFRPVCYQTGRCEFRGKNDRWCVIRERVEEHHRKGEGPEQWADINPMEPLMDGAARAKPGSTSATKP